MPGDRFGWWSERITGSRIKKTAATTENYIADFVRQHNDGKFSYVLDVAEGMGFPDADAHLVLGDDFAKGLAAKAWFYDVRVYLTLSCLCLDSVYSMVFHAVTRFAGSYYIVKYVAT
jgi:hypothetical protein